MKNIFAKLPRVLTILLAFAAAGLSVSTFLAYEYSLPKDVTCLAPEPGHEGETSSCQKVRESEFSSIAGIPVPYFGILYFLLISGVIIFGLIRYEKLTSKQKSYYRAALGLLIASGFIFEGIMSLIQIFVIKTICSWCAIIELLVVAITLTYLLHGIAVGAFKKQKWQRLFNKIFRKK